MFDYGIIEGEVYQDGKFLRKNVYIQGEKIACITSDRLPCQEEVYATNKKILPGFIDPHVHFHLGVGANVSKDDFYTGSKEAVFGGVTTYIDFLDPVKRADQIAEEYEKRMELAKKSMVDYAFHTTIANPTDEPDKIFQESLAHGINSVKLFTTYADTDRRTFDDYIYKLLQSSRTNGGIVVIHAENDELIAHRKDILVKDHEASRCSLTENIEVFKLAQMARASKGRLYIVHVSAGSTLELLAKNFEEELNNHQITLESCPHYFLLNSERLAQEDGYKYTMTPPIRPEADRQKMIQYVDKISTIGTDHCPYTREQKNHPYTSQIPMGIGGIRYSFLNMYQLFGYSILPKFTEEPARAYGLPGKGVIREGMDADLVLFDEHATTVVTDDMSVYAEEHLKGAIALTMSRGSICMKDGMMRDHLGRYVGRSALKEGIR